MAVWVMGLICAATAAGALAWYLAMRGGDSTFAGSDQGASPHPSDPAADVTAAPPPSPGRGDALIAFDDSDLGPLEDLTVLGGSDVAPGVYRVIDPVAGDGGVNGGILLDRSCKWGLYQGAERGINHIEIANVTDGGHPIMRIADGQRAYSQNCGAWAPLEAGAVSSGDLSTSIGDGYWVAGIDIAPGAFERRGAVDADNPDTWCAWTVLESYEPHAAVVTQQFDFSGDGPRVAELADGHVMSSSGCGGWERVE